MKFERSSFSFVCKRVRGSQSLANIEKQVSDSKKKKMLSKTATDRMSTVVSAGSEASTGAASDRAHSEIGRKR